MCSQSKVDNWQRFGLFQLNQFLSDGYTIALNIQTKNSIAHTILPDSLHTRTKNSFSQTSSTQLEQDCLLQNIYVVCTKNKKYKGPSSYC